MRRSAGELSPARFSGRASWWWTWFRARRLSAMSQSRMPHLPTLAISLSAFLLIGFLLQPSREALYVLAFLLMAVVVEVTYRRMDDANSHRP